MGKQHVMTEERKAEVEELRLAGCSYAFIARRVGVTEGSVSHFCLMEGIDSPRTAKKTLPQTAPGPRVVQRGGHVVRHFTKAEDAQLIQMEIDGLSYAEMSRRLDRRHNSIKGRLATLARHRERAAEAAEVQGAQALTSRYQENVQNEGDEQ